MTKLKTKRQPWDDSNAWKNEKEYLNWLRSRIRSLWGRHPIKSEYKKKSRFRAPIGKITKKNPKGMVWANKCEICEHVSRSSDLDVDHIHGGFGFTNWEEFTVWARMILWVSFDDVRLVCKECHKVINLSQKLKISFDEAVRIKPLYDFMRKPIKEQKEELLSLGFTEEQISNKDKRRECFQSLLEEKQ